MVMKELRQDDLLDGLSIVFLKVYGFWKPLNYYRTTGKRSLILKINVGLSSALGLPYFVFQLMYFLYCRPNLQMITFAYLNALPCIQYLTKTTVFWFRIDDVATLYDLIAKDFLTCIPEGRRQRADTIYRKVAGLSNVFCFFAFLGNVSTVVTWICMPGIDAGNGRLKIMGGWYPFPFWESPFFEVVFNYEMVLLAWGGTVLSLYECMMILPLMGLYAHFTVLGDHVASLRKDIEWNHEDSQQTLNRQQEDFIRDYNKLLRYGEILKDVYNSLITFILMTGTGVMIIACLHFLFGEKDVLFTVKLFLFLLYQVIEIILICFCSSYIETASSNIQFAVYQSDWYKADKRFKTAAQILMVRAQRPVTLVAIKTYTVNLETLISIFQFVYSTCALLAKMKD